MKEQVTRVKMNIGWELCANMTKTRVQFPKAFDSVDRVPPSACTKIHYDMNSIKV